MFSELSKLSSMAKNELSKEDISEIGDTVSEIHLSVSSNIHSSVDEQNQSRVINATKVAEQALLRKCLGSDNDELTGKTVEIINLLMRNNYKEAVEVANELENYMESNGLNLTEEEYNKILEEVDLDSTESEALKEIFKTMVTR